MLRGDRRWPRQSAPLRQTTPAQRSRNAWPSIQQPRHGLVNNDATRLPVPRRGWTRNARDTRTAGYGCVASRSRPSQARRTMDVRTTAAPKAPPSSLQPAKQEGHQDDALDAGLDKIFQENDPMPISVPRHRPARCRCRESACGRCPGVYLVPEAVRPPTLSGQLPAPAVARYSTEKTMFRSGRLTGPPRCRAPPS